MGLDEADIALGPLGINFRDVRTSVLFSDNIDLGDQNQDDGVLGIATLGFSVIFQPSAVDSVSFERQQQQYGPVGFGLTGSDS